MPRRDLLKANLFEAWKQCIDVDYRERRINSEGGLLAAFYSHLSEAILESQRRLLIEPVIRVNRKRYFPDLLVCNSHTVIAVVELKYTPRVKARIEKDIKSLCQLAQNHGHVLVCNKRYRGPHTEAKEYGFAPHVVFAWAGVHAEGKASVETRFAHRVACQRGVGSHSLLQLHAITDPDRKPHVFSIPNLAR